MNKIYIFILLCSCVPSTNKVGVEIKPGRYLMSIANQTYSCTDGYTQGTYPDTTGEWVIQNTNGGWTLYLAETISLSGHANGTGLVFESQGSVTIPGICTYPMTTTIELSPIDTENFSGTIVTLYSLVTCSNYNSGSCRMDSVVSGQFESSI